jgi:hypothetical protein
MSDLKAKLILDEPRPCPQCGADVWDVYGHYCDVCSMIEYLKFRHALNWPLTDEDKQRLGLT